MVRVDLTALRRGTARPGELSAIDGHGPVPVATVAGLMDDAFLALVFTEAGDIRSDSHLGRTITGHLRTALAFRDRCCVVPGCGVAYSLEIDHVVAMEEGGPTALHNLGLWCRHHLRMKPYDGWVLARHGPIDEDPGWTFTPQPPFGQEPGLGADIGKHLAEPPPQAVQRNRADGMGTDGQVAAGWDASTTVWIPPRTSQSVITVIRRGETEVTRSSSIRLVMSSWKPPSFRKLHR